MGQRQNIPSIGQPAFPRLQWRLVKFVGGAQSGRSRWLEVLQNVDLVDVISCILVHLCDGQLEMGNTYICSDS